MPEKVKCESPHIRSLLVVCSATVSSLDVHPTLAALAGAKVPTGLDGKDAGPVLFGNGTESSPHDVLFLYASSECGSKPEDGPAAARYLPF